HRTNGACLGARCRRRLELHSESSTEIQDRHELLERLWIEARPHSNPYARGEDDFESLDRCNARHLDEGHRRSYLRLPRAPALLHLVRLASVSLPLQP